MLTCNTKTFVSLYNLNAVSEKYCNFFYPLPISHFSKFVSIVVSHTVQMISFLSGLVNNKSGEISSDNSHHQKQLLGYRRGSITMKVALLFQNLDFFQFFLFWNTA